MLTFRTGHLFAACLAITAIPMSAVAQQEQQQPAPATSQNLGKIEEDLPASSSPDLDRPRSVVTEKRAYGGRVTEIEVQSGGSRYYLQPNYPGSSSLPGDYDTNKIRGPQWSIKQFDLKRTDESRKNNDPTAGTPPPPGPSGSAR